MTVSLYFESPQLAVFHGSGVLKREEVDEVKHALHEYVMKHGPVRVMIQIDPDFQNLEAFVQWDDIELDKDIQKHVIRMAIVGNLRWRDSALLFFMSAVSSFPMEFFSADHEVLARAWLES
ncbi:MAG: hypothetical protein RLZZ352_1615 [Pseudomonadota bacterium]|jgi:ethanolamine utilization protein EutA (predicted chaperonin)